MRYRETARRAKSSGSAAGVRRDRTIWLPVQGRESDWLACASGSGAEVGGGPWDLDFRRGLVDEATDLRERGTRSCVSEPTGAAARGREAGRHDAVYANRLRFRSGRCGGKERVEAIVRVRAGARRSAAGGQASNGRAQDRDHGGAPHCPTSCFSNEKFREHAAALPGTHWRRAVRGIWLRWPRRCGRRAWLREA